VAFLALSRYLSFHARGDAAFVWHGLTGDVAEMSRDVLALLLAFDPDKDEAEVARSPPAELSKDQVEEFTTVLRSRRFLVQAGTGGRAVDEMSPLLAGIPRVPRGAVFERAPERVIIYTRAGQALKLDAVTSALFLRCNGEHSLGHVLGDAGPQALATLLRLARADVAALKILAKPASHGGVQLNPAAESTMPYPEIKDVKGYLAGGPPPEARPDEEPTFASLFLEPHPSLNNRTYGAALSDELARRGAFEHARGRPARLLELHVGSSLGESLARPGVELKSVHLLEGEPRLEPESADAIVANEIGAQLGFSQGKNSGTIRLVREAAAALAPGGVLAVIDFGDPKADATPSSVRFADLQAEATEAGLGARVLPLAEVLGLDVNSYALSTTRASYPALKALFAVHGLDLRRRVWLRSEIESMAAGKLDLSAVHGLQWTPLSERALGFSPRQFWALVAQKPERVLH
jgi:hypothetical protein